MRRYRIAPRFGVAVQCVRPKQWVKNLLVAAPLVFSGKLTNVNDDVRVGAAVVVFCLASAFIYIVNDVLDIEADRVHPLKRNRPVVSGALSIPAARVFAEILLLASVIGSALLGWKFSILLAGYLALMLLYNLALKQVVLIDVTVIVVGFTLRAAAGGAVISVRVSAWLYLATVLSSLFLIFSKRRQELALLGVHAKTHRANLGTYSQGVLDIVITSTAVAVVTTYALYASLSDTLPANHLMVVTIPVVAFGVARYVFLLRKRRISDAPEEVLFSDRPLLMAAATWILLALGVLYLVR